VYVCSEECARRAVGNQRENGRKKVGGGAFEHPISYLLWGFQSINQTNNPTLYILAHLPRIEFA
jgi:hypothetical protein